MYVQITIKKHFTPFDNIQINWDQICKAITTTTTFVDVYVFEIIFYLLFNIIKTKLQMKNLSPFIFSFNCIACCYDYNNSNYYCYYSIGCWYFIDLECARLRIHKYISRKKCVGNTRVENVDGRPHFFALAPE